MPTVLRSCLRTPCEYFPRGEMPRKGRVWERMGGQDLLSCVAAEGQEATHIQMASICPLTQRPRPRGHSCRNAHVWCRKMPRWHY